MNAMQAILFLVFPGKRGVIILIFEQEKKDALTQLNRSVRGPWIAKHQIRRRAL